MTFLCERWITVSCKVLMTLLFVGKLLKLVRWTQHYKIMKVFWTGKNIFLIIVWYLMRELKYSSSAVHQCSFSLISQTISSNIFNGEYSSGKNWNGIGTRKCRSNAKTFLGRLSLQGAPSSKFNNSCQPINSFD